jgi:hypothetical protein
MDLALITFIVGAVLGIIVGALLTCLIDRNFKKTAKTDLREVVVRPFTDQISIRPMSEPAHQSIAKVLEDVKPCGRTGV